MGLKFLRVDTGDYKASSFELTVCKRGLFGGTIESKWLGHRATELSIGRKPDSFPANNSELTEVARLFAERIEGQLQAASVPRLDAPRSDRD